MNACYCVYTNGKRWCRKLIVAGNNNDLIVFRPAMMGLITEQLADSLRIAFVDKSL